MSTARLLCFALVVVACDQSSSDEAKPAAAETTKSEPAGKDAKQNPAAADEKPEVEAPQEEAKAAAGTPKKKEKYVHPACPLALTTDTLKEVCGKGIELKPTFAEGLAGNPCNRSGKGLNLIVSGHISAKVAGAAQKVADSGGKESETSFSASARAGSALVEIRARKGTPCASATKVATLAQTAADNLSTNADKSE